MIFENTITENEFDEILDLLFERQNTRLHGRTTHPAEFRSLVRRLHENGRFEEARPHLEAWQDLINRHYFLKEVV